ncbi:MAG TPA: hypothetical protein VLM38_16090 [Blastocatellia bacterium]|nr:hypothetical protein [Blastocatellia bacterium]
MVETRPATTHLSVKPALQRALPLITSKRIAWLVVGFGVLLRAVEYFSNPALLVDEGALALNIIHRTFAGLLQPLDFNQAAPIGFLMLERIAVLALGDSEYALRLLPFLFSVGGLILFYVVARRMLAGWAVPVALLFFAASSQILYYSTQVKQYSSDVAITLLIVAAGLDLKSKPLTGKRALLFALLGMIVVWISHPSVFVLGGVGATLAVAALMNKQWARLATVGSCCLSWMLSFAVFFRTSLDTLGENRQLEASWLRKGTFMPLPPMSLSDLEWFPVTFLKVFSNPVASPFPFAAALIFIVGCFALVKKNKPHFWMMAAPLLLTLLASGMHKYPFGRRLLLFCLPLILILLMAGIQFVVERARPYAVFIGFLLLEVLLFEFLSNETTTLSAKRWLAFIGATGLLVVGAAVAYVADRTRIYAVLLGGITAVFLLVQPVGSATSGMRHPFARPDIRPMIACFRDQRQPGDIAYVYHHPKETFRYYAAKYNITESEYVIGTDARQAWKGEENETYENELAPLRGRARVWFLFSSVRSIRGVNEERALLKYLDRVGTRLFEFKKRGGSAYLYDLSGPGGVASKGR